jgi:ParB-like chromosome segregation protein Spo0J
MIAAPVVPLRQIDKLAANARRMRQVRQSAAVMVAAGERRPDEALETSLMENTIRAAMHPADEFVAMAGLIDAGATIEAVALRFGTSERHVRQRLRLGKLVRLP